MDYQKLDSALASALSDVEGAEEPRLVVFLHAKRPLTDDERSELEAIGIGDDVKDRQLFTATLSPRAIEALSDKPWVKSMKLSSKLRLLPN
jgi:hypothetical protein